MAKKKVWVVGHKHPDTDSICAAISYANLKNEIEKKNPKTATGMTYIAKRAGSVNAETAYVLERFHAEAPAMISDVGTQIKDIQIRRTEGVNSHISMKKAWEMMKILGVVTLPKCGRVRMSLRIIMRVEHQACSILMRERQKGHWSMR